MNIAKKLILFLLPISACTHAQEQNKNNQKMSTSFEINKSEEEWRKILSDEEYYILREKGTERPYTGKLLNNKEEGLYSCAACGNELFNSDSKFDSHCGWPSFNAEKAKGKITYVKDTSHGMIRTEIMCSKCGGHLGHVFDDGPEPTGLRYCVNSVSIKFTPIKK
jgi:methionine-R-sulfoxide reductase